jgi:hypothetical protein
MHEVDGLQVAVTGVAAAGHLPRLAQLPDFDGHISMIFLIATLVLVMRSFFHVSHLQPRMLAFHAGLFRNRRRRRRRRRGKTAPHVVVVGIPARSRPALADRHASRCSTLP